MRPKRPELPKIPIAREPRQPLHRRPVDAIAREQAVRRIRAEHQAELLGMPTDRRAAPPRQNPDLDLVRTDPHQPIEAGPERGGILARQSDDEIGVQVRGGVCVQPAQIGLGLHIVLRPRDQRLRLGIEGLHTDF